jgi:hypothetical protein
LTQGRKGELLLNEKTNPAELWLIGFMSIGALVGIYFCILGLATAVSWLAVITTQELMSLLWWVFVIFGIPYLVGSIVWLCTGHFGTTKKK